MSDRGPWIQTYTGKRFYPLDPLQDEIHIEDIAHALSLICRFSGHCAEFYSVAEHSIRVSQLVHPRNALLGLLHDAAEAYIGDVARPLKRFLVVKEVFKQAEESIMREILNKFWGFPSMTPGEKEDICRADDVLLCTEARDLMKTPEDWDWGMYKPIPLEQKIEPWSSDLSETRFHRRYQELCRR